MCADTSPRGVTGKISVRLLQLDDRQDRILRHRHPAAPAERVRTGVPEPHMTVRPDVGVVSADECAIIRGRALAYSTSARGSSVRRHHPARRSPAHAKRALGPQRGQIGIGPASLSPGHTRRSPHAAPDTSVARLPRQSPARRTPASVSVGDASALLTAGDLPIVQQSAKASRRSPEPRGVCAVRSAASPSTSRPSCPASNPPKIRSTSGRRRQTMPKGLVVAPPTRVCAQLVGPSIPEKVRSLPSPQTFGIILPTIDRTSGADRGQRR